VGNASFIFIICHLTLTGIFAVIREKEHKMSEELKCARCKHKIERSVCGYPQSPYYNKKVEPSGYCEKFLVSPAQDHFTRAAVEALAESGKDIEELEKALQSGGLPKDDESRVRFFLGEAILAKIRGERQADSPEFKRALTEMEEAVKIGGQGGYEYFSDPLNAFRLQHLASAYMTVSNSIEEREGIDSAITYLEKKRRLFDYLENPPSLLLLSLGERYRDKKDVPHAREVFTKILEIPETSCMGEFHAKIQQDAMEHIRELQAEDKKSGCFIATAVYGKDDAPEVEALRHFRDNVLLGSRAGRGFVSLYYRVSPPMADVIRGSGLARNLVRTMLLRPVLWLIPKISSTFRQR
jgi:hypothetical protein